MSLRDELNLVAGEQAWLLEARELDPAGRLGEAVPLEPTPALRDAAKRLLLEVAVLPDGRVTLVHRAGWPFDLRCAEGPVEGLAPEAALPRGAGDEVMRELVLQSGTLMPGRVLVVRDGNGT